MPVLFIKLPLYRGRIAGDFDCASRKDKCSLRRYERTAGLMGGRVWRDYLMSNDRASKWLWTSPQMAHCNGHYDTVWVKNSPVQYEGNHAMFGAQSHQKSFKEQTAYEIIEGNSFIINGLKTKLLKYQSSETHWLRSLFEIKETTGCAQIDTLRNR